jgi:hypothetical protein
MNDLPDFMRQIDTTVSIAMMREFTGRRFDDPELNLMTAILIAAIEDIDNGVSTAKKEKDFHDAQEWFASEDWHVFSFLTICSAMNLDPSAVRKCIANRTALALADRPQRLKVYRKTNPVWFDPLQLSQRAKERRARKAVVNGNP